MKLLFLSFRALFLAYAKFASQIQGHHVQIVVEANADVQFLRRSAVANFPNAGRQVSSATLYYIDDGTSSSCANAKEIRVLTSDLEIAGVDNILCKDGLADLFLDGMNSKHNEDPAIVPNTVPEMDQEEDEEESEAVSPPSMVNKPGKSGGVFARLIVIVCVVLLSGSGLYCYGNTSKNGSKQSHLLETLQVLIIDLSHAIQKFWTTTLKFAEHFIFTGIGGRTGGGGGGGHSHISSSNTSTKENNTDAENQSEHSPLVLTT